MQPSEWETLLQKLGNNGLIFGQGTEELAHLTQFQFQEFWLNAKQVGDYVFQHHIQSTPLAELKVHYFQAPDIG